jgi:phosphatidate cytidylyltransferase
MSGYARIFFLLALVWASDIGAYAFGRLIGGPKLAPALSPNKTWAGALGGLGCAMLTGVAAAALTGAPVLPVVGVSVVVAVAAQLGDLAESYAKRRFGVKDSSHLIPGHGGLLDRIDSLLAAALALALLMVLSGGSALGAGVP